MKKLDYILLSASLAPVLMVAIVVCFFSNEPKKEPVIIDETPLVHALEQSNQNHISKEAEAWKSYVTEKTAKEQAKISNQKLSELNEKFAREAIRQRKLRYAAEAGITVDTTLHPDLATEQMEGSIYWIIAHGKK